MPGESLAPPQNARTHTEPIPSRGYLEDHAHGPVINQVGLFPRRQFLIQGQHSAVLQKGLELPAEQREPPEDEEGEEAGLWLWCVKIALLWSRIGIITCLSVHPSHHHQHHHHHHTKHHTHTNLQV